MSSNDPERDGGPDADKPTPEPEPLDVDRAFAAIVAAWAKDSPATWPAEEDLSLGRHRRTDDPPPAVVEGEPAADPRPEDPRPPRGRAGGQEQGTGPERWPRGRRREDARDDDGTDDDLALTGSFTGPTLPSVEPSEHGPEDDIGGADAFVPPDPPLPPRGDVISTLAWAGVLIGPAFLLLAVLVWRDDAPQMLVLAAVAAFIGGFVTLVARMPRHRDDDDDDGAVV